MPARDVVGAAKAGSRHQQRRRAGGDTEPDRFAQRHPRERSNTIYAYSGAA